MNIVTLIRPNIQSMKSYSCARDEYQGEAQILLDANESPFETGLNRYPDPAQTELRQKISGLRGIPVENIICSNGSDELIDQLIRIFCEPGKDSITIFPPTFGMYEVAANLNNIKVIEADLKAFLEMGEIPETGSKICFIPSPLAPQGTLIPEKLLIDLVENFKGIVVVDEAYIDFAPEASLLKNLSKYKNLVILQTFSKFWGLAGVRVGMGFANSIIIEAIAKIKAPYSVSTFAQKKAIEAIENKAEIAAKKTMIIQERVALENFLNQQDFIKNILPSVANFLFVETDKDVSKVYDHLTMNKIVVRSFEKLGNFMRISVGTPEENEKLKDVLQKFER